MIDNNVKILSKNEMKPYVDYFRENCKIPIINNKTNEISNKVPNQSATKFLNELNLIND